ncbi:hypothetical protein AMTR_s00089p00097770 [Amborella trichopoda]|uniref:HMG box domain-containing protein n=1 Tax=Amborella trichopoda TaxID=13333 RepID=W1P2N5_AMBTC|nr:hypothetical protein AMTR_s00089p00097770 [Amborella trichopoda]
MVIKDRRWKEITALFNYPSTATNASFVLRKYYVSLLYHYEQIYFFRSRGCDSPFGAQGLSQTMVPSPDVQAHLGKQKMNTFETQLEAHQAPPQRRKAPSEIHLAAFPQDHPVNGVIDGKFEHGYLVTVTIGSEKLKGVLYHTPAEVKQAGGNGNVGTVSGIGRRRRRKKSEMRKRDPLHPKPNRSGYNFFFAEQHARLKPLNPGKDREISKKIGELWNNLTEEEKAVYQERGVKDKERYRSEMVEYRERLKSGNSVIGSSSIAAYQTFLAPVIELGASQTTMGIDYPPTLRNFLGPEKNGENSKPKPADESIEHDQIQEEASAISVDDNASKESKVVVSSSEEVKEG